MKTNKFLEYLKSEEGKKSFELYMAEIVRKKNITIRQLERFHLKGNFNEFVEKVIDKYNSDNYRERWYKRGIEPIEELYWFLFEYAKLYGREATDDEWVKISNMFTTALYYCNGYFFERMDGQGSCINIIKENKEIE